MRPRAWRASDEIAPAPLLECAFGNRSIFERYIDHDERFRPGDFLLAVDGERVQACVQVFEKIL